MPEIGLDSARVVAVVGELVTASMAKHVGVRLDAEIGGDGCPLDHGEKPGADLAGHIVERIVDKSMPTEEQERRKRALIRAEGISRSREISQNQNGKAHGVD